MSTRLKLLGGAYPTLCVALPLVVAGRSTLAQSNLSIRGTVVEVGSGLGVGGALVQAQSRGPSAANANTAKTDALGGFHLDDLAPGDYEVTYRKAGFETPSGEKTGEAAITLATGMPTPDLHLHLLQLGFLEGHVYDALGDPVAGAGVELVVPPRGTSRVVRTDVKGHFAFEELRPGIYLLWADDASLLGHASRYWEVNHLSAPAYFPGVSDRAQAVPIVLRPGSGRAGCDIHLPRSGEHSITGVVDDAGGVPASGATLQLKLADGVYMLQSSAEKQILSGEDGAFTFMNVPSGRWQVVAESAQGGRPLRGYFSAVVTDKDLDGVRIDLWQPFTLEGEVQWNGDVRPGPPPRIARVRAIPLDRPQDQTGLATPETSGRFRINGIYEGYYRIAAPLSTARYYLQAVLLGDREVTNASVYLSASSPPIRLIYSTGGGILRGTVQDGEGASVVLLPRDTEYGSFRAVRFTECDTAGRFELDSLRPGDYYALAVRGLDKEALADPSLVPDIAKLDRAEPIRVEPATIAVRNLQIVSWHDR